VSDLASKEGKSLHRLGILEYFGFIFAFHAIEKVIPVQHNVNSYEELSVHAAETTIA
jgi:hypothetical protein